MWELPAELQMWLITNLVPSNCLHTHLSCPIINPAKQPLWGTKEWYSTNPPGHHSTRDSHFLFQCSTSTDRIPSISLPTHAEKLVENNFLALTASMLSFISLDQQEDRWYLKTEGKWCFGSDAFDALEAENRLISASPLLARPEQNKLWNTHPIS